MDIDNFIKLDEFRRIAYKNDISIILPLDFKVKDRIPLDCPVCKILLQNSFDIESYREFKCCKACKFKWAEKNRDKWKSGWRPSDIEINEFINYRNLHRSKIKFNFD
jgi:hypothetical protein